MTTGRKNHLRCSHKGRGFTILEVMVGFMLLTLVSSSILLVYSSIFAGTRHIDTHLEPLYNLEILAACFRDKANKSLDVSVPRNPENTIGSCLYQVEDLTIIESPVPGSPTRITMRRLIVHVFFTAKNSRGEDVEREYVTTLFIGQ